MTGFSVEHVNKDRERFEAQYIPEPNSGCWIWTGSLSGNVYGQFYIDGVCAKAHRYSAELYGIALKGMNCLHSCDAPLCVNPDHLRAGTHQSNMDDKVRRSRCSRLKGERNPNSKLTLAQVSQIKESNLRQVELARMFGVSQVMIGRIKNGKNWRAEDV